jgi:hypothetical protein
MARPRLSTALALPFAAVALALVPAATASAAPTSLTAAATSANESKGGLAGASAKGTFTADPAAKQFCYTVDATKLDDAVAMHIHKAAKGADGAIVIPLDAKKIGAGKTCTSAPAAILSQVVANPAGFYLNVHTPKFPAGAVRGQLVAATTSSSSSSPSSSPSSAPSGVNAGSGGGADDNGMPLLPVALLIAGAGVVGVAGWRLARR